MNTENEQKTQYLGHRKRVRKKLLSGGSKGLLDYEILEIILYSSYP
ncbi:DNA repair protein radC-like protein, partial [Ehrlichia ruminantium]